MDSVSLITLLFAFFLINVEGQEQVVQHRNRIHQRADSRVNSTIILSKHR